MMSNNNNDDSIIDVSNQSHRIDSNYGLISKVPTWTHHYVYSYSELKSASKDQRKFYINFKVSFLQGDFLDLEGNSNYAFILLFDFLEQYNTHKNLHILESQLRILGEQYSKTKSYAIDFLIGKMKMAGDKEGQLRLESEKEYFRNTYANYSTVEWRDKIKKKLNLSTSDAALLDRIWYSNNSFSNIEFCGNEVVKLYIATFSSLRTNYMKEGVTLEQQFTDIAQLIAKRHFKEDNSNYKYKVESLKNEFYAIIFKQCENALREYFGHKRMIAIDAVSHDPIAKQQFETKIAIPALQAVSLLRLNAGKPDRDTELKLNRLNSTRWKTKLEKITFAYKNNHSRFFEKVVVLGEENVENPSVENIFFEASKFIAAHNKEIALKLYIYYLYYDLKSTVFDNKQLTKTIQKGLFETNEQLHNFQIIISDFISDKDLEKALNAISDIYSIKRKKIKLDISTIKEVQEKHSDTVELLNEYLKDDYEDENNSIKSKEINNNEIEIEIVQKNIGPVILLYKQNLCFTIINIALLDLFVKNNFSVLQEEIGVFAKSKGVFKNQLIESINEICYDDLDDILIEEDEEYFTINQDYYKRILA